MCPGLLHGTEEELSHSFPEVSAQECVQNGIDARVEVGDKEGERGEEGIEGGGTFVVTGPKKEKEVKSVDKSINDSLKCTSDTINVHQ